MSPFCFPRRTSFGYVLILTCLLLLLDGCEERKLHIDNLPWQITTSEKGNLHVFDVTLEESTLWDAARQWRAHPSVGIFSSNDKPESVEAYFDKVQLGPITAKIVVKLATTPEQLKALYAGRYNRKPQPSGSYKFELGDAELKQAFQLPIREITYLPAPASDAELITKRFGKPASFRKLEKDRSLWLYPEKGLAIILDKKEREVFQYINPRHFAELEKRMSTLE